MGIFCNNSVFKKWTIRTVFSFKGGSIRFCCSGKNLFNNNHKCLLKSLAVNAAAERRGCVLLCILHVRKLLS